MYSSNQTMYCLFSQYQPEFLKKRPTINARPVTLTYQSHTDVIALPVTCHGCFRGHQSDLNECVRCGHSFCENCSCDCYPRTDVARLYSNARRIAEAHIRKTPTLRFLDSSRLVIEDEWGGLLYSHGEMESFVGQTPLVDEILADQLPPSFRGQYGQNQSAVWREGSVSSERIILDEDWSAILLPMFVDGERYTVGVILRGRRATSGA